MLPKTGNVPECAYQCDVNTHTVQQQLGAIIDFSLLVHTGMGDLTPAYQCSKGYINEIQ